VVSVSSAPERVTRRATDAKVIKVLMVVSTDFPG